MHGCLMSSRSAQGLEALAGFRVRDGVLLEAPTGQPMKEGRRLHPSSYNSIQGELSNDYCGVVVEIGKDCHDKLVSKHVASSKLGSNKTAILGGSTSVWNWCSYVAQSLPSMKACETKIDDECGKEIGLGIFYGKGQVTKGCCSKPVRMGAGCHDRWVKTILARPEFVKSSNAILDRSTKIWKKCVSYF
ncbi:hypothetical protein NL676_009285 [Syzygium grande]|nr:hypothetical protein NL676_009285 [Syzygium grande]